MRFSFNTLLLSSALLLGQIGAVLAQDKIDPVNTNIPQPKDRQLNQDELRELYEISSLVIKYNTMKLPPLAVKLSSQQDIADFVAHSPEAIRVLPVIFEPSRPDVFDYKDISLQDMIERTRKDKSSHMFLTEKGHTDKGYMLSLENAEKIQRMDVSAQKQLGLSGTIPLFVRYHDTPHISARYTYSGTVPLPSRTTVHTGTFTASQEEMEWTFLHEGEHHYNTVYKAAQYRPVIIRNGSKMGKHYQPAPDDKTKIPMLTKWLEEFDGDSAAGAHSHEMGAFLALGADDYKRAAKTSDTLVNLMIAYKPAILKKNLPLTDQSDDHPADYDRLVKAHRQHQKKQVKKDIGKP